VEQLTCPQFFLKRIRDGPPQEMDCQKERVCYHLIKIMGLAVGDCQLSKVCCHIISVVPWRCRLGKFLLVLSHFFRQGGLIGSHHFINLGSILVKMKGRHCLNPNGPSNIVRLVYIHLDEFDRGIILGHLFEDGGNEFARTAPYE
jgi:hypothetical protein